MRNEEVRGVTLGHEKKLGSEVCGRTESPAEHLSKGSRNCAFSATLQAGGGPRGAIFSLSESTNPGFDDSWGFGHWRILLSLRFGRQVA